jgi:iron complex outermembrane receptor protein
MPVLATGDQVGGNGPVPGVSGDRRVIGAFAETTMPLRKDTELNLAGRFDNYQNGFGTSFNSLTPKASLRYQPMPELVFRTAAGTGYRAPTLYENLRPLTTGNNTNGAYNDPVRCPNGVPVNSVNPVGAIQDECGVQLNTATSGSTSLKPETSKQFSFGVAFQPTKEFSGSIDYWNVRINNVIQQQSEIQVMSNPSQYASSFYRYNPASFPTGWVDDGHQTGAIQGSTNPNFPLAYINLPYANQGEYFASGLDVNARYQTNLPELNSTFVANLDGTLMLTHGYAYLGEAAVSDLGVYKDQGVMPRWRHMLTFSLKQGNWSETLTNSFTSGYQDYTNAGNLGTTNYPATRMVTSNSLWGASVLWKESKNMEFLVGVKNLLNTPPPVSRIDTAFQVGYDATLASPLGRQFRLMAKYTF